MDHGNQSHPDRRKDLIIGIDLIYREDWILSWESISSRENNIFYHGKQSLLERRKDLIMEMNLTQRE